MARRRTATMTARKGIRWLGLVVCGGLGFGAVAAPAPGAGPTVFDACQYASETEARAAWRPMGGTAPVGLTNLDGRPVLRLPCNFAGTKIERASWDRRVTLDLTTCRGLEFELLCRDASPVSHFSLYLQSGEGWYHTTFYPESTNDWNTIRLDKAGFGTEGRPAGWAQVRTLRLSAWRGQDRDTELFVRDFRLAGALGRDAQVAILRADSLARTAPEEARGVTEYVETTAELLQHVGLGCAVLSDLDLVAEQVQAARVIILPHNPRLPDAAARVLSGYAARGGKLLVCYVVPEQLRAVLKVQSGRHVREPRPGFFASIRPKAEALAGAPAQVGQRSWNIQVVQPLPGAGAVLAEWYDDQGQPTGHPAAVGSTNGLVFTHVLLRDDFARKARFLLALVGHLAPDLWETAARAALDRVGLPGRGRNFEQAAAAITALATNRPRALAALAEAGRLRDAAREQAARRQFAAALDQAGAAQQRLIEAWCLAQASVPGEFRGFWCHSAFGVPGMTWNEALARLATNGFTAILPNMLWGGVAFYPSKVLPVSPEVAKRGDQLALCLAAAKKHGLQVHVWKVNWNLGRAPREFVESLRRAGRLQASSRGQEEPWLCPSHPDNQRLEIESMLEVARNYDVAGLHFDYIRYPDSDHCFCAGCRERFQKATGAKLANWPRDVLAEGPLRQQWLDWRRSHITAVVRAVAEQAHALKPGLKISAAVFRNWPVDRDGVGQDWKLWCDRGWLDFVCPMNYTASHRQFENMVARQVQWAGRVPCYPGIGESASSSRLGPEGVIEQIQITRRYRTGGFVIFNYGAAEATELVPLLGLGITAAQ